MTVCLLRFVPKYAIEVIFKGTFKRFLFITCVSYIRRCPCPFIWTDTPSTTDLQIWLTQTLSVCESSLLTAGQWPGFAMFANIVSFYFLFPYITWINSEFLLFSFPVLKGDPLSQQTRSSAVCHDWRHAEQGKAWYCLTARGWRNLSWIPFQHVHSVKTDMLQWRTTWS